MMTFLPLLVEILASSSPPHTCSASGSGSWPAFQPLAAQPGYSTSAGNHRAVIVVSERLAATSRGVVTVDIPWRRHDPTPQLIDAYIVDALSHVRVTKCTRLSAAGGSAAAASESATFTFLTNGPGEYHLYYMPFSTCELMDGNCKFGAHSAYAKRTSCADAPGWWTAMKAIPDANAVVCPPALQSRSAFSKFAPMGLAASRAEVASIVSATSGASGASGASSSSSSTSSLPLAIAVVEDRQRPLRMRRHMPSSWATRDLSSLSAFVGTAQRGEAYTFQVAVWAVTGNVTVASVAASAMKSGRPGPECFNFAGSDYWGRPYHPLGDFDAAARTVEQGQLLPLWFLLNISDDATVGATLHSDVTISIVKANANGSDQTAATELLKVTVDIVVNDGPVLADHGDGEAWRGTRLAWLNSKQGIGADAIPLPFTPIVVHPQSGNGFMFELHDKNISIARSGLPLSIKIGTESLVGNNTANAIVAEALSSAGVALELALDAALVPFSSQTVELKAQSGLEVSWISTWKSASLTTLLLLFEIKIEGSIDVTGFMDYVATISSVAGEGEQRSVDDSIFEASLVVANAPSNALLTMGLGVHGGDLSKLKPVTEARSEWLVIDMKRSVSADYLGIYAAGDGIHDPQRLQLFTSSAGVSGPWVPAAVLSTATSGGGKVYKPLVRYDFKFGDQEVITSRYWRLLITAMEKTAKCAPSASHSCQAWIGEVQLRDAKTASWINNTATSASNSIVVASSGAYSGNEAWKAADGNLAFVEGAEGWDAADKPLEGARFGARWFSPRLGESGTTRGQTRAKQQQVRGEVRNMSSERNNDDDSPIVIDWSWDGQNGNNGAWVGSSAAGVRLFLKGESDLWQAAVPFDSRQTPLPPPSWDANGGGGITLRSNGTVRAFTGSQNLTADAPLVLRWSLLATPTRPVDLAKHFAERYVQTSGAGVSHTPLSPSLSFSFSLSLSLFPSLSLSHTHTFFPLSLSLLVTTSGPMNYTFLAENGATVVNIHQGNGINPWINYPYKTVSLMADASKACHALGMRFKIYNTMRELSNRCDEIWAMRAFAETYVTSNPAATNHAPLVGSGADWLQEHVESDYLTAWSNPVVNVYPGSKSGGSTPGLPTWSNHYFEQDAAIKVKALSRWNNYYVEGLRQMRTDFNFDGLYLDEIAYDRVTMRRSKHVLGPTGLIDHHSDQGGFTLSPAMNYLELYPFIDSLWCVFLCLSRLSRPSLF